MSLKSYVKQMLVNKLNKDFQRALVTRKISYDTWVRQEEGVVEEQSVARNEGDFVVFSYANGLLSTKAPAMISEYMQKHPEVMIAYGDEDFMDGGKRTNPWYKPCWSPDLYQEFFYFGSVVVVRLSLLARVGMELPKLNISKGVPVATVETVANFRVLLDSLIGLVGGYEKDCRAIGHIEYILFHGNDIAGIEDFYASKVQKAVPKVSGAGKVSVIIPSKDNPEVLATCLKSLEGAKNVEIIVVDNGSSEKNRIKYQMLLEGKTYIYKPMAFDFSEMCNMGVEASTGKFLLFLNDDMEMQKGGWLKMMKEKAAQPYVGAVGLKLLYPGTDKIQHAGIVNLPVGPVHKCQFASDSGNYYFGRNKFNHNCIAVTGACLMIEKEKYMEAGGLSSQLPVAYNDVELGFALYEKGYQNVILNKYVAYHHESLSRGNDELSKEKLERLFKERAKLYEMHPALKDVDPYYPKGLSRDGLDSRFAPEYYSVGNEMQVGEFVSFEYAESEVRVDRCLMVAADTSVAGNIRGYGVVLGDNNACYDLYAVLIPEGSVLSGAFQMKVQPQYRQDLEENMPDQENVALSGFWIRYAEAGLPSGTYGVSVLAVHKINKGKILNDTGRSITVC